MLLGRVQTARHLPGGEAVEVAMTWRGRLLVLMMVGLLQGHAGTAWSIPILWDHGGEKIVKYKSFPDTADFQNFEGYFYDAGVRYKQVRVFWLPLWNYDVHWCGYVDEQTFLDLDYAVLSEVAGLAGIQLPRTPPVPLWDQLGGKLVMVFVIFGVGIVLHERSKARNTESPEGPWS